MPKPSDDSRLGENFSEADRIIDGLCDGHDLNVGEIRNAGEVVEELLPTMRLLAEAGRNEPDIRSEGQCGRLHLADAALADFRIIREIGRGGMGVVFEGVEDRSNRHFAVKLLPWRYAPDMEQWRERFRREAAFFLRTYERSLVRKNPPDDFARRRGRSY